MDVDLSDVERLAWEGLLREQREAALLVGEIGELCRRGDDLPRPVAILRGIVEDIQSGHAQHGKELASAIAVAHGQPVPARAPRFVPAAEGRPARLADAEPDPCPVVPPPPAP